MSVIAILAGNDLSYKCFVGSDFWSLAVMQSWDCMVTLLYWVLRWCQFWLLLCMRSCISGWWPWRSLRFGFKYDLCLTVCFPFGDRFTRWFACSWRFLALLISQWVYRCITACDALHVMLYLSWGRFIPIWSQEWLSVGRMVKNYSARQEFLGQASNVRCYVKSNTVFTSFYLKDVQYIYVNVRALGPIVAAGQVI